MFTLKVLDSVDPNEDGIVHDLCEFFIWVFYAVVLTMLSATSVRIISAEAIGSGVPEMKSVLRGSVLENYLTLRTLVSVFCGLTLAMGSGMPIGKAGPFIHASSIMANLIGQLVFSFDPHAEVTNSKQAELLAVGCAVGTSCVFSSPIGGVLFAIEVSNYIVLISKK
jgi:chloride channel 2